MNRRRKYGLLASVITLLGIAVILTANIVLDRVSDLCGWSVDLTEDGRYAVSRESKEALEGLDGDVTITVLNPESDLAGGSTYVVQVYQILQQYQRISNHISVRYVDLVENPTYASAYSNLSVGAWNIVVESGEKQEAVSFAEMYDYSQDGTTITASRAEQKLTNAILSVTSEDKPLVTVLTGYSDGEPDDMMALLSGNQFLCRQQSLLTEEIDPQAAAAVLYAPSRDLESAGLKKLDAWLENGGEQGKSLLVFLDPNMPELPKLEEFLGEWGIRLGEGLAFEANSNLYYERAYYPIAQYADMDYAEGMTSRDLVIMALCRPVDVLYESRDNTDTKILLQFTQTSGSVKLGAEEIRREDVTGDIKAMVMGRHSWYGSDVTHSQVVVSGSALAFSGSLVTSDTFANGRYILGLFRKLAEQKSTGVVIPARDLTQASHRMNSAEVNLYIWIFLAILPGILLVIGILVWIRRRNL